MTGEIWKCKSVSLLMSLTCNEKPKITAFNSVDCLLILFAVLRSLAAYVNALE